MRLGEVLRQRGDAPGLVHVFSAMEACQAFKPWHDKMSGKTGLRPTAGNVCIITFISCTRGCDWCMCGCRRGCPSGCKSISMATTGWPAGCGELA